MRETRYVSDDRTAQQLASVAFPNYTGRKIRVTVHGMEWETMGKWFGLQNTQRDDSSGQ